MCYSIIDRSCGLGSQFIIDQRHGVPRLLEHQSGPVNDRSVKAQSLVPELAAMLLVDLGRSVAPSNIPGPYQLFDNGDRSSPIQ